MQIKTLKKLLLLFFSILLIGANVYTNRFSIFDRGSAEFSKFLAY